MNINIPQKEEGEEIRQHPLFSPHLIMEICTFSFGSMRAEPERDRVSSSIISNQFHGTFLMFKYDLSSAFSYFILQFYFEINVIML